MVRCPNSFVPADGWYMSVSAHAPRHFTFTETFLVAAVFVSPSACRLQYFRRQTHYYVSCKMFRKCLAAIAQLTAIQIAPDFLPYPTSYHYTPPPPPQHTNTHTHTYTRTRTHTHTLTHTLTHTTVWARVMDATSIS